MQHRVFQNAFRARWLFQSPIADLAALTGWPGWMYLVSELLELSTLNTRRFLFRLPESLSRWLDQASRGFACSAARRRTRFYKLRTEFHVFNPRVSAVSLVKSEIWFLV